MEVLRGAYLGTASGGQSASVLSTHRSVTNFGVGAGATTRMPNLQFDHPTHP